MVAATSPEAAGQVVVASTSGWLAGILATLTETNALFERSPLFGFVVMALLGAFAGWALMVETGKFDEHSTKQQLWSLARRIGIGIVIGVAVGVWWLDSEPHKDRGLWMLIGGFIAAAPVEMFRAGLDLVVEFIRARVTNNRARDER